MDSLWDNAVGGTYVGNPVALAAAVAVLDVFEEEGLVERAQRIGETVRARMLAWQERFEAIGDVRGLGAMLAVEYVEDRGTKEPAPGIASRVAEEAAVRGLLLLKAGVHSNCNRVLCPLVITDAELEEGARGVGGGAGSGPCVAAPAVRAFYGRAGTEVDNPCRVTAPAARRPDRRPLRARGARGDRRHVDRLPRARPPARAARRDQDPPRALRRRTRSTSSASAARRARSRSCRTRTSSPSSTAGTTTGRQYIVFEHVDGENLKELVVRSGRLPVRQALELALAHRRRALLRARARARPPRREAAERPPQQRGRGQGDRLRHRALAPRRARRHADRHGARHRRVPRARAGERQARLARDRRLLARRRPLGAAGGRRPVRRRELRRGRAAPRQRAAAAPARAPAGRVAAARRGRAACAGEGSGAAASPRWRRSPRSCGPASPSPKERRRPRPSDLAHTLVTRPPAPASAPARRQRRARSRRGPLFYALLALLVAGAAFAAVVLLGGAGHHGVLGGGGGGSSGTPVRLHGARRDTTRRATGSRAHALRRPGDRRQHARPRGRRRRTASQDFGGLKSRCRARPRRGQPRQARAPDGDDADARLHGGDPGRRLADRAASPPTRPRRRSTGRRRSRSSGKTARVLRRLDHAAAAGEPRRDLRSQGDAASTRASSGARAVRARARSAGRAPPRSRCPTPRTGAPRRSSP